MAIPSQVNCMVLFLGMLDRSVPDHVYSGAHENDEMDLPVPAGDDHQRGR